MRTPKYEQPTTARRGGSAAAAGLPDRQDGVAPVPVPLRRQLRHEVVAVAAVDRAHELDDGAVLGAARPLEEEGGRVQRDAERARLLLVRDRRLDRLEAARDRDPVARAEQLVERVVLEVPLGQAGTAAFGYLQG